jgi:hypothetical protein
MSLDISKIKARLNSLSNTNQKSNLLWKPTPGKQEVRIVPYKFSPDCPFSELKFHYNLNGKTYLSPDSFGRPDPIVEFAARLKKSGDKEEWKLARKLEPKMRTFAPVIVRGQENEGVKYWGFGKQVYQELLSIMSDPDYGDITDLANGRDIVVEFKTAEETGKQFPETSIRVKPNTKPAVDPTNKELLGKIANQTKLLDLFPELSYEELKTVMDQWLHPEEGDASADPDVVAAATAAGLVPVVTPIVTTPDVVPTTVATTPTVSASTKPADVSKAFEDLFTTKE